MVNEKKEIGYRKENALNMVAGLLIGSLAGAILMILLARHSGIKTRNLIWQRGMNFHGRVVGTYQDLVKLTHFDNRQIPAGLRVQPDFSTPQPV